MTDEDDTLRRAARKFEAVKVSMSQDKNGVILRLNVHPQDCPPQLHTDWVGSRYVVVMVRLNDDDTPDTAKAIMDGRLVTSAGLLCRASEFYAFLKTKGLVEDTTDATHMEEECAKAVRSYCGIKSRSRLADDELAQRLFIKMRAAFAEWREGRHL